MPAAQDEVHLTSFPNENGDATFCEENLLAQTDDLASLSSYVDTGLLPQQQQRPLYSNALPNMKTSLNGSCASSISDMCDLGYTKTASDEEETFAPFAMIERDDGYLATT